MSARNDWAPHFRRAKLLDSAQAERENNREVVATVIITVAAFLGAVWCVQATIIGWLG